MTEFVSQLAVELAGRLPGADIDRLATAVADGTNDLAILRSQASSPIMREACDRLLSCTGVTGERLAGLLIGASATVRHMASAQSIDLVWTGPASEVQTSRTTAVTITELIDGSTDELMVVSYASRRELRLVEAVTKAVHRGVDVTLLLERNVDNPSYTATTDPFDGLQVRRWTWPRDRRPADAALHAKIVVVDQHILLLGSANLTGRALAANLECGVLIRGGSQPADVRDHLWSLRRRGVLRDAG